MRVQVCNGRPADASRDYVLYWMIANRRRLWNFGLQRAVHGAVELRRPLLVVDPVTCDYPWANARIQMPAWVATAAARSPVLLEKVDSSGIFPMRATDRVFTNAHSFRRFLQKELPAHPEEFPLADSLAGVELPRMAALPFLQKRRPAVTVQELSSAEVLAGVTGLTRSIAPVSAFAGGAGAALERLKRFVRNRLEYALDGRDPNSSAGIFWTLGRYDRPWAPQRPIFGSIRYTSSDNAARKLRVKNYIKRYYKENAI